MSNQLKVEDFEVVIEKEPMNGCDECYFYQIFNGKMRCFSVLEPIGLALEVIHGDCINGHHYKLKTKNDEQRIND